MVSHEKATLLSSKLNALESKLVYLPQNLVDLTWKVKPIKPDAAIYIRHFEFAGFQVGMLYLKAQQSARQYIQVGTLVTSLSCISEPWTKKSLPVLILLLAYILNLRGSDIPYNPLFHSYLFISLDSAILFVESSKIHADVAQYLKELNVQLRPYTDLWPFLRRREWGEGKYWIRSPVIFEWFFFRCLLLYPCWSSSLPKIATWLASYLLGRQNPQGGLGRFGGCLASECINQR